MAKMWKCNSCGQAYSTWREAVECHPDVVEIEVAEIPDSHGPTLRAADQTTIELLRRLRNRLAVDDTVPNKVIDDIDAVLKTAAGG